MDDEALAEDDAVVGAAEVGDEAGEVMMSELHDVRRRQVAQEYLAGETLHGSPLPLTPVEDP